MRLPRLRKAGRVKIKLAAALQRNFPDLNGSSVTWHPEDLWDAKGGARTGKCDVYRWSGASRFTGSGNTAYAVDSFCTMTECVKARDLEMWDREVWPVYPEVSISEPTDQ